jgi:transposase-like protein
MNDRIAKLQLRIRALHRGHAASQVRYPEDLRAEIIAVARAGQTVGGSVYRLAREIGVSAPTLIEWLRRPARERLRQITVAPAPATTMGAPTGRSRDESLRAKWSPTGLSQRRQGADADGTHGAGHAHRTPRHPLQHRWHEGMDVDDHPALSATHAAGE